MLHVNLWTVLNWEKGHTEPPIKSMPAIFRFLGYDPFPEPKTLPERLLAKRREMGWSIKEAAMELGVDEGTWGDWERGKTILFTKHRELVAKHLKLDILVVVDTKVHHEVARTVIGRLPNPHYQPKK